MSTVASQTGVTSIQNSYRSPIVVVQFKIHLKESKRKELKTSCHIYLLLDSSRTLTVCGSEIVAWASVCIGLSSKCLRLHFYPFREQVGHWKHKQIHRWKAQKSLHAGASGKFASKSQCHWVKTPTAASLPGAIFVWAVAKCGEFLWHVAWPAILPRAVMNVAPVSEAIVDILAFHPYIHLLPLLILQSGWRGGRYRTWLDIWHHNSPHWPPLYCTGRNTFPPVVPQNGYGEQRMSLHPPPTQRRVENRRNFNAGGSCAFKRAAVRAQKT